MAQASSAVTFEGLKSQLASRKYAPVYLLHGEEGYYIDELLSMFENIIPEADRYFNLYTFYAPETGPDTIMDACRRYPMMSDYQVVIVKEAQAIRADQLNRFHLYASQPTMSTILVISCRGAQAKAKDLIKQINTHGGVVFESQKVTDRNAGPIISGFIKQKGLNIETKGLAMLRDYVGTDLSRLYNEIDKLTVALAPGSTITPEVIERHIGMSKDYNNFELVNALALKDFNRAFRIVDYFRRNPKNNPVVVTIGTIWNYFSNLLLVTYCRDRSESALCAEIGIRRSWLPDDYKQGIRNYNAWKLIEILHEIRVADCRSKGVGSRMDSYDILNDLVFHILTAPGKI